MDLSRTLDDASARTRLDAILDRLRSGEGPGDSAPGDVIAALAFAGLGPDPGPPLTRGTPPRPALLRAANEPGLSSLLPRVPRPMRLSLAAGLLQILDFWEESHEAAQEADDSGESRFAPYWHAIAHRREPDPGNAGYWFRRVGRHPAFVALAEAARPPLDRHGDPALTARLLPGGAWDPMAFVAFCGAAPRDPAAAALARRLQAIEMRILLGATLAAC